ncbi:hypothetical protein CK203_103292 [Vitis vinifera]|uniref:Uncharacterized protein n=1 Tax=Vitis vinifera TaxID=29760 RepID=A0A438FI55_VITVI|nr:hypothetical protein CK203_103292 [Vitis vinifera]
MTRGNNDHRSNVVTLSRYPVNSPMIALWDEAVLFFHFGCTEKPMEIVHHLCEFGSVEYHVQSSASDST